MTPPMLTVAIPYFQRTRGLLTRCVSSVLSQSCAWQLRVVIADDESPLPANEELPLALKSDPRVKVVQQSNAGPSAARNLALDNVPRSTGFLALIDADDWWEPGFVAAAEQAFEEPGVDLFFSDSRRYSESQTRLQWAADPSANLSEADHPVVKTATSLRELQDNFFDLMLRRSSIVGTSSIVYRWERATDLRFDARLRGAEDRLFKLQLALRVRRVRFSTATLTSEGEGVNVFDSVSWGTSKGLRLAVDYLRMGKRVLAELPLEPAQRRLIEQQLNKARLDTLGNALRIAALREALDWKLLASAVKSDPLLPAWLPVVLARAVAQRLRPA